MAELDDLSTRLDAQVTRAARRLEQHAVQATAGSAALAARYRRFHEAAARIVRSIMLPRLERAARLFEHARLLEPDRSSGTFCRCRLPITPRFPAYATLELGLAHDGQVENALVCYDLDIQPLFMRYDRGERINFSLDKLDDKRIAPWVDEKLAQFVETYLRLEFVDRHQGDTLATDPVCRVRFSKVSAVGESAYGGHVFYFVSAETLEQFHQDPGRYVWLPP